MRLAPVFIIKMGVNMLDANDKTEKVDMNTSKEETERILKNSFSKIRDSIFAAGVPIRTVDERGVHDLYPDGTKKYTEKTKEVD